MIFCAELNYLLSTFVEIRNDFLVACIDDDLYGTVRVFGKDPDIRKIAILNNRHAFFKQLLEEHPITHEQKIICLGTISKSGQHSFMNMISWTPGILRYFSNHFLLQATVNKHFDTVKCLANSGLTAVDLEYWNNYVIATAVANRRLDVVQVLINKGVKPKYRAIKTAVKHEYLEIVQYLSAHVETENILKALVLATNIGNADIVQCFVNYGLSAVHIKGIFNECIGRGDLKIIRYFVEHWLGIENLRHALFDVVYYGRLDIMQYFCTRGITVEDFLFNDSYVLYLSIQRGHLDMVKYFLRRGLVFKHSHDESLYALQAASSCGYLDIVKVLVRYGLPRESILQTLNANNKVTEFLRKLL